MEGLKWLACMRVSADVEANRVFMIDQNDADDIKMLAKCAYPNTTEQRQRFKYTDQTFVCCDEEILWAPGCISVQKKGAWGGMCVLM